MAEPEAVVQDEPVEVEARHQHTVGLHPDAVAAMILT